MRPGNELYHKDPNKPATEMNAIWLCAECGEIHRDSSRMLRPGKKREEFDRTVKAKIAHGYCKCPGCQMCLHNAEF